MNHENAHENSYVFKIKSLYNTLRASEKKVADYVLKNSNDVSSMSLSQLSQAADVSDPTVMRFVKTIGFNGFSDFKLAIVKDSVRESTEDNRLLVDLHICQNDRLEDIPSKMMGITIKALEDTLKLLDLDSYKKAVQLITTAKTIDIYGVGNSGSIANDMMNKLLRLGLNCRAFSDNHLQQISACHLTKDDVAIGISHSGSTKDTVDALRIAKMSGAATVALTNFKASYITQHADISFCTGDVETTFYSETMVSRISQLALVDAIYMGILLSDYDNLTKRLDMVNMLVSNKVY